MTAVAYSTLCSFSFLLRRTKIQNCNVFLCLLRHTSGDRLAYKRSTIFWAPSRPNLSFSFSCFTSAGRPHSRGAAGAGEYPPAEAGAAGGHSGITGDVMLIYAKHACTVGHVFDCRNCSQTHLHISETGQ